MAQYPNEIFTPREKENIAGVEYDPTKKRVLYVEDLTAIEDEVKELETRLMPNTETPLPYGVRIGNDETYFSVEENDDPNLPIPVLTSNFEIEDIGKVIGVKNFLISSSKIGAPAALAFYDSDNDSASFLYYSASEGGMFFTTPIGSLTTETDSGFAFAIEDEEGNLVSYASILLEYATGIMRCWGNYYFNNTVETGQNFKAGNIVEAVNGYKVGSSLGVTSTYTVVGDVRMDGGVLQKRTRTITTTGGIITSIGALSAWTNA